jgi:hypothetical protein
MQDGSIGGGQCVQDQAAPDGRVVVPAADSLGRVTLEGNHHLVFHLYSSKG